MKKFITVLVLAAMLLTTMGLAAAAESYMIKQPATCEYSFEVKKADPAVVKKDGVIDLDGGEYVKAEVPIEELSINFRTADVYMAADAMSQTMEYYFSWDETNGFNLAVKYLAKGKVGDVEYDGYYTNIDSGVGSTDPAVPQDNFMSNIGINFATGTHKETEGWSLFYYAIGKKFDGTYLTGHWNQLGNSGAYSAEGGKDFEVAYPGDGSVIFEWSIPFAEFIDVAPTAGTSFSFALSAAAGFNNWEETNGIENCWSVSLGQNGGWLVQMSQDNGQATATLSDEPIKEVVAPATSDEVTTNEPATSDNANTNEPATNKPATSDVPTQEPVTSIVTDIVTSYVTETDDNGDVMTDDNGDAVTNVVSDVVSSVVTQKPNNDSPVTGDPMIIAAVVAAISACGVVVAKKRK